MRNEERLGPHERPWATAQFEPQLQLWNPPVALNRGARVAFDGQTLELHRLEGEVIESDGTRLQAGDFVSYPPGSHHNTRTETGCLLIGFDWGKEAKGEPD